jgi:hypothetical protein
VTDFGERLDAHSAGNFTSGGVLPIFQVGGAGAETFGKEGKGVNKKRVGG